MTPERTNGRISGRAAVGGVAGQPIVHSLSPIIHNAWIAAAGLDAAYVPFGPADEAGFDALAAAGRAGLLAGINVTAPFKERALALADTASETARRCGSANLLIFRDGAVWADSTDGQGVRAALAEQAPDLDLAQGPALVLGAGGAARAAVAALIAGGAPEVRVLNRSPARAETLAAELGRGVRALAPDAAPGPDVQLVVNAVSGGDLFDLDRTPGARAVLDMSYRPLETPLLAQARARGAAGVDGLAMLIGQAAPAFEAIFGAPVPADVPIRALVLSHLGEPERAP